MLKSISGKRKWLAAGIILIVATLVIGGCTQTSQPPASQPPVSQPPVNHPPVIDKLASEFVQVKKAMAAPIVCTASDPDGDELSYIWSVTGGNITGEGATVTWVAPNVYGTYTITAVVTDGRGGQATESIDIKVACCPREATE